MNLSILFEKDAVQDLLIEKLGQVPIDFCEKADCIKKKKDKWGAAGVLIPLAFGSQGETIPEWSLILIKRSSMVAQAGDLSCPGGMLESLDSLLRHIITCRLVPVLKGRPLKYARDRGTADFRSITLFLANALRESWEEVNLSPFYVDFLGPLACRNLVMFSKTIFPLVGLVKRPWLLQPNHEVEKIIHIPLRLFFQPENYGIFSMETGKNPGNTGNQTDRFTCFVYRNETGQEEILWGATFGIIMSLLKTAFDFEVPGPTSNILRKTFSPQYLKGSRHAGREGIR
jgi:8-oxo-dGTP pyrophosphatase MutT (NUDIX family)